jgi:type IV secretion system protein VirB6
MDEAAPITWLINQIHTIVASGAGSVASSLTNSIAPVVAACFGIYVLLVTVNYMRGGDGEPVWDFALRMVSWALVIGIGLSASAYASTVIPIVTGIGPDLANSVSGGSATAGSLDQLALYYLQILDDGYTAANAPMFPANIGPDILYFIKAALVIVGLVPFLVAATLTLIISDVGLVIIAMVGPLFFAFLLFPATRQWFSAWLNSALSYALLPLFIAVISLLSVNMSQQMLGNLNDASLKTVFFAAIGNLTLLFLVKMVASLASSLSAGGIHIGHVGGVGAAASFARNFGVGSAREIRGMYRGGRGMYDWYKSRRGGGAIKPNGRKPG